MLTRVLLWMRRVRWIFLPLGLCALTAVGAHAAADVVGGRVLWCVDRAGELFDSIFARWPLTAPLVELIGPSQRTLFARAAALIWELLADALIAIPLLGYDERDPRTELGLARTFLRAKGNPARLVRPLATLLVAVAGSCAVARMVQGSVQLEVHSSLLSHLLAAGTLLALLALLLPRAVFRSLEHAGEKPRFGAIGGVVLVPMMIAAVAASPLTAFFR